jgi:hypothetical protein
MANSEQIVGLLPPPPGVMPNFDHPDSIAYRLVIATTVCLVASTAVLLLRLYTKRFIVHTLGTEDCTYSLAVKRRAEMLIIKTQ